MTSPAAPFFSPHSIAIGRGRILYAPETIDRNGEFHPAGWVLPGGARTQSRDVAETVASNIDRLSK